MTDERPFPAPVECGDPDQARERCGAAIIQTLEFMLDLARSGHLTALAVIGVTEDRRIARGGEAIQSAIADLILGMELHALTMKLDMNADYVRKVEEQRAAARLGGSTDP